MDVEDQLHSLSIGRSFHDLKLDKLNASHLTNEPTSSFIYIILITHNKKFPSSTPIKS